MLQQNQRLLFFARRSRTTPQLRTLQLSMSAHQIPSRTFLSRKQSCSIIMMIFLTLMGLGLLYTRKQPVKCLKIQVVCIFAHHDNYFFRFSFFVGFYGVTAIRSSRVKIPTPSEGYQWLKVLCDDEGCCMATAIVMTAALTQGGVIGNLPGSCPGVVGSYPTPAIFQRYMI